MRFSRLMGEASTEHTSAKARMRNVRGDMAGVCGVADVKDDERVMRRAATVGLREVSGELASRTREEFGEV